MGIDSLLRIDSLERIDSFVGIDSQWRIDSGAVIPFQISISLSRNRFPIFWESTQPYFWDVKPTYAYVDLFTKHGWSQSQSQTQKQNPLRRDMSSQKIFTMHIYDFFVFRALCFHDKSKFVKNTLNINLNTNQEEVHLPSFNVQGSAK